MVDGILIVMTYGMKAPVSRETAAIGTAPEAAQDAPGASMCSSSSITAAGCRSAPPEGVRAASGEGDT